MVVVGSGSSSRFGGDKLMTVVAGEPLVAHTVRAVSSQVDQVILVCRSDQLGSSSLRLIEAEKVAGGSSRTRSEIAGLKHLSGEHDLVGIHDAARPLVTPRLVETLFKEAARIGGAIPVVDPAMTIVHRDRLTPIHGLMAAQTPQVFRTPELLSAYRSAEEEEFDGYDTADVVSTYADLDIAAVPGEPGNIKVTYPEDLRAVRAALEGLQRRS